MWNYVTRNCIEGWKRGSSLELADCEVVESECPSFESSLDKYQEYTNFTWNLGANQACNVTVSAIEGVARVIFADNRYIGIDYKGYGIDDVITIPQG